MVKPHNTPHRPTAITQEALTKGKIQMKNLNLTDHQIAELIEKHGLILRSQEGVTLSTSYYSNDDLSFELLVILNNTTLEKETYTATNESIYNIDLDNL